MLTIYMDDSGSGPTQGYAVAAGWIAKMPAWKLFDKDWAKVTGTESHKIECLHTADFVSGYKDFKDWGDLDKKAATLKKLRAIIKKRALKGFGFCVIKKDFDELVPDQLRSQGFQNHYTYAIRRILGIIHHWRGELNLLDEPIEYVFDYMDKRDPRRREIERVFDSSGAEEDNFTSYGIHKEPIFRSRKDVPVLQAADLLAWTMYQAMLNEVGKEKIKEIAAIGFRDFVNFRKNGTPFLEGGYHKRNHVIEWIRRKGFSPLVPV
jgi:hypothetical protein